MPVERGQWGMDLFNPASLKQFGIRAGGGAAAGGMAGLAIDAVTGGLSLGAAAVLGATLGALWSSFESHGRRIADVFRGYTELRVRGDDAEAAGGARDGADPGVAAARPRQSGPDPPEGGKPSRSAPNGRPGRSPTCCGRRGSIPEWSRLNERSSPKRRRALAGAGPTGGRADVGADRSGVGGGGARRLTRGPALRRRRPRRNYRHRPPVCYPRRLSV